MLGSHGYKLSLVSAEVLCDVRAPLSGCCGWFRPRLGIRRSNRQALGTYETGARHSPLLLKACTEIMLCSYLLAPSLVQNCLGTIHENLPSRDSSVSSCTLSVTSRWGCKIVRISFWFTLCCGESPVGILYDWVGEKTSTLEEIGDSTFSCNFSLICSCFRSNLLQALPSGTSISFLLCHIRVAIQSSSAAADFVLCMRRVLVSTVFFYVFLFSLSFSPIHHFIDFNGWRMLLVYVRLRTGLLRCPDS